MYQVQLHAPANQDPWINCPYKDSNFTTLEEATEYVLKSINMYYKNTNWSWRIIKNEIVLGQWPAGIYETLEFSNYRNYSYNSKPTIEI